MSPELFTRQNAARCTGGVWDYVSASRLNLWLKCPLAFQLRYVDGVESPVSPAASFVRRTAKTGAAERVPGRVSVCKTPTQISQLEAVHGRFDRNGERALERTH